MSCISYSNSQVNLHFLFDFLSKKKKLLSFQRIKFYLVHTVSSSSKDPFAFKILKTLPSIIRICLMNLRTVFGVVPVFVSRMD